MLYNVDKLLSSAIDSAGNFTTRKRLKMGYLKSTTTDLKAGDVVRTADGRRGTIADFSYGIEGQEYTFINFGCDEWSAYLTSLLAPLPIGWGTEYATSLPKSWGSYPTTSSLPTGLKSGDIVLASDGRRGKVVDFQMRGHPCRYEVVRIDFGNGEVTEYFSCDTFLAPPA